MLRWASLAGASILILPRPLPCHPPAHARLLLLLLTAGRGGQRGHQGLAPRAAARQEGGGGGGGSGGRRSGRLSCARTGGGAAVRCGAVRGLVVAVVEWESCAGAGAALARLCTSVRVVALKTLG